VYLADHFGDGGFYFFREAWIIRTKNGFEIVTRQVDHEIDLEKDTDEVTQDVLEGYTWQQSGRFVKQQPSAIDKKYFPLYCSSEPVEIAPSLSFTNFTYYSLSDVISADFNGDSVPDMAVFWKENGKKGIILTDGRTKKQTRFGLGISFGAGGDNFDWVDHWGLVRDSSTFEVIVRDDEVVGDTTVRLLHPSIYVGKEEVGGGVITYRAGKYVWVHQAD
jgi:hypothetical protein